MCSVNTQIMVFAHMQQVKNNCVNMELLFAYVVAHAVKITCKQLEDIIILWAFCRFNSAVKRRGVFVKTSPCVSGQSVSAVCRAGCVSASAEAMAPRRRPQSLWWGEEKRSQRFAACFYAVHEKISKNYFSRCSPGLCFQDLPQLSNLPTLQCGSDMFPSI